MFELTRSAVQKTVDDIKKICYLFTVGTQFVYLVYLVYSLLAGRGNIIVNALLTAISLAYFIFFLIVTELGKSPKGKSNLTKPVAKAVKYCKRIISLYNLGVALYAITVTAQSFTVVAIVCNALMLIGFLFGVIFDILVAVIENRLDLFMFSFKEDLERAKQPAKAVGNFFKKITGREVEEAPPKTEKEEKTIAMLEGVYEKIKEQKALSKQAKKEEKLQKRAKEKARRQAKKARRHLQALPTPGEEVAPTTIDEE